MRALTPTLLLTLPALVGCDAATVQTRLDPFADAGMPTADDAAMVDDAGPVDPEMLFESTVAPLLENRCAACHDADRTGPAFLADPVYDTLLEYPALVDLEDPGSSRLLTKGAHAGPAWPVTEADAVRGWVEAEAASSADTPEDPTALVEDGATEPVAIVEGLNVIDLEEAASGIAGARLTFVATRTGAGVFLAELRVYAGATGIRLRRPVLVTVEEGVSEPDPVDRFAGIELQLDAFESALLGTGSVSLVGFPEGGQLAFVFDRIGSNADPTDPTDPMVPTDPTDPMDPTPADGCRAVAAFTAEAQPQLSAFCSSCHAGGNATATAALDMTGVRDSGNATAQADACGQLLGAIDPMNPSESSVWRAPDRGSDLTGHDFKFPTATQLEDFRGALGRWLAMEE